MHCALANKCYTSLMNTDKNTTQSGFTAIAAILLVLLVFVALIGTYILRQSSRADGPPGTVYTLPPGAPQPTYLEPQPPAVGNGANPVVTALTDAQWASMNGKSWHPGCPVGRAKLSYMEVNYWGFDGYRHRGQLVFNSAHKSKFVSAFTKIHNKKIPLHGMYLVDKFGFSSKVNGADDYASMQHDNTSAFNCRWVVGNQGTFSPHSYGTAVDINPFVNPYHSAEGWVPNRWWATRSVSPYTWRTKTSEFVKLMSSAGFKWTYGTEDAQHFDTK
jgi:hypothetical protein